VDTTLGASTLKVAIAPSRNSSNRIATTRLSGSKLVRKEREHHRGIAVLKAEKQNYPEYADSECSRKSLFLRTCSAS
jgi:hypothetical protein